MENGQPIPYKSKGRVLVVEHAMARRQRLYDLLTRHGCSVQAVASQTMALDALQHDWPDLILAGQRLPDTTGFQLAHRIRFLHDSVPIIVLGEDGTGAPSAAAVHEVQACLSAEAPDEALLAEVDRWLTRPPPTTARPLPCSVLVVDDEPKLRSMLKRFLELHHFTVATTASGEEALTMLQQHVPMFVLLDVGLNGMDGLVTLKKIKALSVPTTVIMVTGNAEEETLKEALALGAQDYVQKPFSPSYLESVLLSKLYTG